MTLLRQVTVLSRPSPLFSPSASSSSSSDDSDAPPVTPKRRLLRRVGKSAPTLSSDPARAPPKDKPLPPIPHGVSDTRSLQTDVCVGFPKRPRMRATMHRRHPSVEEHSGLPDGLYKGKLRLDKNMLPSIDWAGLGVKVSRRTSPCSQWD